LAQAILVQARLFRGAPYFPAPLAKRASHTLLASMCEPVTCAIAAGVICCCCCIGGAILGWTLYKVLVPLMGVVLETVQCVNETLDGKVNNETFQGEECAKAKEAGCDAVREEPDQKAECKKLQGKCTCEIVGKLVALQDPNLEEMIQPCCETFQKLEENSMFASMAEEAVGTCHQLVANASEAIEEVHKNCTQGNMPDAFDDYVSSDSMSTIAEKFEIVGQSLPVHRALPRAGAVAFGGGAMIAAVFMVASVWRLRGKRGRPQRRDRDEQADLISDAGSDDDAQ